MNILVLDKREKGVYQENADYGYQCVARAKKAVQELFGIALSGFGGSANNGWITGSPFNSDWVRVPNTVSAIPAPGDVIFRGKSSQLPYGHVAIVKSANKETVTVMEQNAITGNKLGKGGDAITTRTHTYVGIVGRFHYKKNIVEPIDTKPKLNEDIQALVDAKLFSGDMEGMTPERLLTIVGRVFKAKK